MRRRLKRRLMAIAREAHMLGRIYNELDEPKTPAEAEHSLEVMVEAYWRQRRSHENTKIYFGLSCGSIYQL